MKWCLMRKTQKVQRKAKMKCKVQQGEEVELFDL